MGACVSAHSHPSSLRLPSSHLPSHSADLQSSTAALCHGVDTRAASSSQSQSSLGPRAEMGLLTGNKRSSLSHDVEQLHAVCEQLPDSNCSLAQQHSILQATSRIQPQPLPTQAATQPTICHSAHSPQA